MVSVPILKWMLGTEIIATAITLALSIQSVTVGYALLQRLGWKTTTWSAIIVGTLMWLIEFIGSTSGIPFGKYSYTSLLQPQFGHVPLLVPIAWFMMLPTAWTVAELLVGRRSIFGYVVVSGLAMTAWDLFLDPQMVEWGFWEWQTEGGYFGIPWSNYLGWLLSAMLVTLLVRPYRFNMPRLQLLTIYGIVWFLQTFGQAFFWNQFGPALVGGLCMGALLWASVYEYWREAKRIS